LDLLFVLSVEHYDV